MSERTRDLGIRLPTYGKLTGRGLCGHLCGSIVTVVAIPETVPEVPPDCPVFFDPLALPDLSAVVRLLVKVPSAITSCSEDVHDLAVLRRLGELVPSVRLLHSLIEARC